MVLTETAFAHEEVEGGVGFLTGLLHPALGFDHLLAMLGRGHSQRTDRRQCNLACACNVCPDYDRWRVSRHAGRRDIPMVEAGIAVSVVVLGIALAAEKLIPEWVAIISVAIFGAFHGHAHGTEMPSNRKPVALRTRVRHRNGLDTPFGRVRRHWFSTPSSGAWITSSSWSRHRRRRLLFSPGSMRFQMTHNSKLAVWAAIPAPGLSGDAGWRTYSFLQAEPPFSLPRARK